jgi:hypothetical protein
MAQEFYSESEKSFSTVAPLCVICKKTFLPMTRCTDDRDPKRALVLRVLG